MILGLAPMDGITDFVYRRLVDNIFKKQGNNGNILWKWTEFMSADGYMINPSRLVKHLITRQHEKNCIAQIYGGNNDTLVKTAQDIERKYPYFRGIELNIGCPSPKILACGAGAGMMRDKARTLDIIKQLSESTQLPFSIKTRNGLNNDDKKAQMEFIKQAAQYCPIITIHGRTYQQAHQGEVDRDFIYEAKQQVGDQCIIIGNGGITHYEQISLHQDKVDGIMIGQAAIHNPRIFSDYEPTYEEKKQTACEHLLMMGAYEIYMDHTRQQYPEMSDQLMLNRKNLHLTKKYDPDSDEAQDIPPIDFHDYLFPFPLDGQIDQIYEQITNALYQGNKKIIRSDTTYDLSTLHCAVDFRKYCFGYIKGRPDQKELKQQIITTKDMTVLYQLLQQA